MLQIFQEAHVLQASTDAPGAHHGGAQDTFTGDVGVAVEGEVGEVVVAVGAHNRHALGTVAGIVVITGGVPAVQTGSTPIQLVFQQQAGQPAFAVHLLVVIGGGTVVHIPSDAEGIPQGHFAGHASPEGIAVVGPLVAAAETGDHAGTGATPGITEGRHGPLTIYHLTVKHAGTHGGVHGPRGHLHAVEGQGQQHGKHVHIVHVIVELTISITEVAILVVTGVVIVGASPESGQANVFVELVVQADGGHVIVHDLGGIGGEAGQSDALDTHADLQVGLGHHPVDVGALQFHKLAVSAQGAAVVVVAPHLVTDFEEHGAGQGFGSHGVQLQANTLGSFEFVFVVAVTAVTGVGGSLAVTEVAVHAVVEIHDPLALGLEVDSVGAGSHAHHHSGSQSESHKLLHDNTFLHYFRIFRSHPLRDLFPLRDPIPDLCGAGQESRPIRPELKAHFLKPAAATCLSVELVKIFKPLLSVCQY